MYHNLKIKFICLGLFLLSILFVHTIGCDSLLPDEFENKEFKQEDIDARACDLLSIDVTDSTGNRIIAGKIIDSKAMESLVDTSIQNKLLQGTLTLNQVLHSEFNKLIDSLQELDNDSLLVVRHSVNNNITFAKISFNQSKDIYIYTSLQYNEANINLYINIELVKNDTSLASSSTNMKGESVSACTKIVRVSGSDKIIPTIRTRYRIHVEPGEYIVRFVCASPAQVGPFKILILSI